MAFFMTVLQFERKEMCSTTRVHDVLAIPEQRLKVAEML
jgi:hypothetical protein